MNDVQIYNVPEFKLPGLQESIARLNKRAAKLGVPSITVNEIGHEDRNLGKVDVLGDRVDRWVRFIKIAVIGETPKFAGWSFVATVEHTENGNVLRAAPSFKGDLSAYRTCKPFCFHCRTERNRNDTFLVLHEEQGLKQLGRNCIKDFLGHQDPKKLAAWAEIIAILGDACGEAEDCEDWDGAGGSSDRRFHLLNFLEHVAFAVETSKGFWTRAAAEKTQRSIGSTKDEALFTLFPPKNAKHPGFPSEDNKNFAKEAHGWLLETYAAKTELSDFEHNLLVLAKGETITHRDAGLAAFIVEAYRRELGYRVERKSKAASQFVGTVGVRARGLVLSVVRATPYETQFGAGCAYGLRDEQGNVFSWLTSAGSIELGGIYKVDATVKKHEVYRECNQTVLSRVKVTEDLTPAPLAKAA